MARVLVMSIKPRYAERIFAGSKAVELRRTRPHVAVGDLVLVYASSPVKALIGAFTIGGVVSDDVSGLWERYSSTLGVSQEEYDDYFAGAEVAHGLLVADRVNFTAVPLDTLRRRASFRPPQSYMFWDSDLERLMPPGARRQLEALPSRSNQIASA
jgi:predicted transcriptional regulator